MAQNDTPVSTPVSGKKEREVQGCIPYLLECLFGGWSPAKIALGAAFGVLIGLIPKASVLCPLLLLVVFLLGGNLLFGAVTFLFCTLGSRWTAPMAESLGETVLGTPGSLVALDRLYELPLLPWTQLNNTLVLGQTLIGLGLFLPVFFVVWGICPRRDKEDN